MPNHPTSNFALLGAAGFVAPRHLKAIRETGGQLLAALDPHDAVGVMDAYFPGAAFFTEFERFDRHLEKLKKQGQPIDYLSVCSPNYLHDAHVRYGLRYGAEVICEKPLVLNPWNLEALRAMEQESGRRIWTILQLRHHPHILALKQQVEASDPQKVFDLELTYITPRGNWYYTSWKGDESRSGGIITNIGIHLFDMLLWIFGPPQGAEIHLRNHGRAAGYLQLERARVRWFLSIEAATLPAAAPPNMAYRNLRLDGQDWAFSEGFSDLHTESYRAIVDGQGFGLDAVLPAVDLTHRLRNQNLVGLNGVYHPLAGLPLSKHPFEHDAS
ncbi:MAG: Gfo/Idh/MocA family oxidoreductase [Saprospiraceae bacterium]